MSNLSSFVKRIRDVMRNDAGINGDAQRIEQIAWMLFLKVYDAKEEAQKRIKIMIKPLADRIVVKPAEAEQKTSSGLFIPDNAKEKPMQGKVVAVGPGRKNDKGEVVAMEVKVGDVVLYGKYSGTEVTVDGENYLIVKESDVIATL